jgi:YggT family protein
MRMLLFLLETVFYLLMGAAMLRAYMNWLRISMTAQPGTFVMALTNWIVQPLRRMLPAGMARARLDWASVLAACLMSLAYALLTALLLGWMSVVDAPLFGWLVVALKMLVRVALQSLTMQVFAFVIISWVQPGSPVYALLGRLVEPPLAPLRRIVPVVGGVDLSAMALLLLLQLGLMALG